MSTYRARPVDDHPRWTRAKRTLRRVWLVVGSVMILAIVLADLIMVGRTGA